MAEYKILVVDDEEPIANILDFNLKKEGYDVIVANDGEKAVELAFNENPDLILLDLMLPKKDGMEVCREVRAKKNIPIIMLTAKNNRNIIFKKASLKSVLDIKNTTLKNLKRD